MKPWERYSTNETRAMPWEKYAGKAERAAKPLDPTEYDPASPEYQAKYGPAAVPVTENLAAGAGKAVTDIVQGVGQRLGKVDYEDVAATRQRDAALMDTKAGKIGKFAGTVATLAPVAAIPGANTLAGAALMGGATGFASPSESAQETAINTGLGAVAGAAGQKLGEVASKWAGNKLSQYVAKREAEQASNSVRDATLAEARQAGYVVPPSTTNPTVTNRVLESISGKAATQQSAAVKNQQVTNALARRELGLPKDAPLTADTMEGLRAEAGKVYEAVKGIGSIAADEKYVNQLTMLSKEADNIARSFPNAKVGGAREIQELQDAMLEPQFDAGAAVEFVKTLRKDASDNLSFGVSDPARKALGRAQSKAAGVLEGLIERNLGERGQADLMQAFREARVTIAKSYTVQRVVNEGSGNVVATKLAAELRKDKMLTGGLKTAAKFASAFPRAASEQVSSPGVSAVDALIGGGLGMTVNPSLAALPLARIGARGAILSDVYQNAMTAPSYTPDVTRSAFLRLLQASPPLAQAAAISVPANVR